ncbi:unannotated protein [freshwater metagenome]|uniref:Unannotated protein n=1 Tax=freshwater metagenome TaxID=449393 RepID=A0A6J7CYL0_9ZZZZ
MTQAVAGRRAEKKIANRTAILQAAREIFAQEGFDGATVRDIVRGSGLASGTFYNYFPDKESVLREILDETTGEIRARVHVARSSATTAEGFVCDGFRAYFEYLAGEATTLALMSRNAGVIRALFDEPAIGAGVAQLRRDLDAGVKAGMLAPHDTALMAAAMVGAGVEIVIHLAQSEFPDVDGAVGLLTAVFVPRLTPS